MSDKLRLDIAVFERGFAESREKAKAMIMAGSVYLNGQKQLKGGTPILLKIKLRLEDLLILMLAEVA